MWHTGLLFKDLCSFLPFFRSRKKPHQANGAIHTKPQKHKRTPEKKAKQTDYDKGQSAQVIYCLLF